MHYFKNIKRSICPREAFRVDLVQFIQDSFEKNFRVIVCLDANKYFKDRKLAKRLEKIGLIKT